ncbi:PAS domain-containing protein [Mesorhizobium humile]|uniref:Blue-light-activated histidine kinase n=1 Tax=Mesorhizobium humile TaxID=3072313 RepID=A0ABU4YGI0_9HYPH|nr:MULTISPECIES: PAS domain-containing protein [unclassified Mesorhizobium]MDX8457951.1 PAS domain-containing protein [Mesorhizobium sp. VK2D]MDX8486056.1 PAS domain-containing protein [Mesorhizobium sp. VK2B]
MSPKRRSHVKTDRPAAVTGGATPDWKELAATAFQRTRMPMVVADATGNDYPIVLANAAFLNLTGYEADEVLGRNCRFLQGKATSSAAVAEIRSGLREQREVSVELLNYRKDGTPFWNRLHISPVYDDDERVAYYFGSQIDSTEYRRIQSLEASEHRLLLEVDHRANNVLALVDSIVRLTKSDNSALYAASVQDRIQSLARAHALLARRGWQNVPLREAIQTQLEPYGASRAVLEGPDIMLLAHAVQPLALFIHELAINAATHGSLSGEAGQVAISWSDIPQTNGLVLIWEETGGPPPSKVRKPGFGTVVAEATVRRQLQGSAERQWLDRGVKVLVEVPNVTTAR